MNLKLGSVVGAGRWPNPLSPLSPPWRGEVIAPNDKRAWEHTIAFPYDADKLNQRLIDEHVERHGLWHGAPAGRTPSGDERTAVLWDFGTRSIVYWSDSADLVDYDTDVLRWKVAISEDSTHQVRTASRITNELQTFPGQRDPEPGNPHYRYFRLIVAGGRVWRDDPANQRLEWVDLESLKGRPAEVRRLGSADLSLNPDPVQNALLTQKLDEFIAMGTGSRRVRNIPASTYGIENLEFGCKLMQIKADTAKSGPVGIAARIACARLVFEADQVEAARDEWLQATFDFSADDFESLFEGEDGGAVKGALLAEAQGYPHGDVALNCKAMGWMPEVERARASS